MTLDTLEMKMANEPGQVFNEVIIEVNREVTHFVVDDPVDFDAIPMPDDHIKLRVRHGKTSLQGVISPAYALALSEDWKDTLAQKEHDDPRSTTRHLIAEYMTGTEYREGLKSGNGAVFLGAAIWLTASRPDSDLTMERLQAGNIVLDYEILINGTELRFKLYAGEFA